MDTVMELHVIINPAAAAGRTRKVFRAAEPLLIQGGHQYEVHVSERTHGIGEICRELTENITEDINLLILGGDGSVHDAVNGIADFSHVRLGFLPCGSGNDQIRDMGLPQDPLAVLARFLEGKVRRTADIGEVTFARSYRISGRTLRPEPARTERFNVSAGIGFDAAVCRGVSVSRLKPLFGRLHIGRLIYLWTALGKIVRGERFALCLETDGVRRDLENVMFAAVMNHQYEGGGFRFCPEADYADGFLDYCAAVNMNAATVCRIFIHAFDGGHVRFREHVLTGRGKCLCLEADRPLWVHLDGEVRSRASRIEIRPCAHRLQLLI